MPKVIPHKPKMSDAARWVISEEGERALAKLERWKAKRKRYVKSNMGK